MIVRDYEERDALFISAWHEESRFNYKLPDFDSEYCAAKKVVTDLDIPIAAAMARITVEIYGFCDQTYGTPGTRLVALKMLHAAVEKEMKAQNIRTACAWLPPELAKSFGRRLLKTFGWKRPLWPCFAKDI